MTVKRQNIYSACIDGCVLGCETIHDFSQLYSFYF